MKGGILGLLKWKVHANHKVGRCVCVCATLAAIILFRRRPPPLPSAGRSDEFSLPLICQNQRVLLLLRALLNTGRFTVCERASVALAILPRVICAPVWVLTRACRLCEPPYLVLRSATTAAVWALAGRHFAWIKHAYRCVNVSLWLMRAWRAWA